MYTGYEAAEIRGHCRTKKSELFNTTTPPPHTLSRHITCFSQNRKDEELLKRRNIEIPEDDDESLAHLPTLSSCSPETLRALVEVSILFLFFTSQYWFPSPFQKAQSANQPEQFDAVQLVR